MQPEDMNQGYWNMTMIKTSEKGGVEQIGACVCVLCVVRIDDGSDMGNKRK